MVSTFQSKQTERELYTETGHTTESRGLEDYTEYRGSSKACAIIKIRENSFNKNSSKFIISTAFDLIYGHREVQKHRLQRNWLRYNKFNKYFIVN